MQEKLKIKRIGEKDKIVKYNSKSSKYIIMAQYE